MSEQQELFHPIGDRYEPRAELIERPIIERPIIDIPLADPLEPRAGAAHANAGDTEIEGAHYVKVAPQTRRVLDALASRYPDGYTDTELSERLRLLRSSINARRGWLVQHGWVEDSGERRTTSFSTRNIIWRLTAEGVRRWWERQEEPA